MLFALSLRLWALDLQLERLVANQKQMTKTTGLFYMYYSVWLPLDY